MLAEILPGLLDVRFVDHDSLYPAGRTSDWRRSRPIAQGRCTQHAANDNHDLHCQRRHSRRRHRAAILWT
jgi:hypothetical protein